jgi:2-(1,2-epoxy-1,2-dihydrophenyl)acetyl-CoA isomerase
MVKLRGGEVVTSAQGQPVQYHPKVRAERTGDVVTVTIDNPTSKNACTGAMWVAIGRTFRDLAYSGARCVVLTGANGEFCAGADLTGGDDASGGAADDAAHGDGRRASQLDGMRVLGDVVLAVHDCPVPVVAKVDGVAVGAGLGLALSADLTWCSDRARFSAIFAKRGISLDFGTSWLLRQRMGVHKAKQLALTAEMVNATRALELGFVNAVVPVDELDAATAEVVDTIAGGPPIALSMTKRELDHASTSSLAQALETEALAQSVNVQTEDIGEAMTAFFERRPPKFSGR